MSETKSLAELRELAEKAKSGDMIDKYALTKDALTVIPELLSLLESAEGRVAELETNQLIQRVDDYRSGYSCGFSDGKNGTRMRDKDAACLFFNIVGVPDILDCAEMTVLDERAEFAADLLATNRRGRQGVYIASKTKHAAKWKALRDSGVPIISTWIDEAGIGETKSFPDLWRRCVSETRNAAALVVYAEDGDELKGALIEVGAALASETPVFMVGNIEAMKTARNHPLVRQCGYMEQALELALSVPKEDVSHG